MSNKKMSADSYQVGGSHYKNMKISPWDYMASCLSEDEFVGYLRGNVIKYISRAGAKGDADDALNDLKKAMHYLEKLLEVVDA